MDEPNSTDSFFQDLESGVLSSLTAKVRADDTLTLQYIPQRSSIREISIFNDRIVGILAPR
jgi:hypothetical protein